MRSSVKGVASGRCRSGRLAAFFLFCFLSLGTAFALDQQACIRGLEKVQNEYLTELMKEGRVDLAAGGNVTLILDKRSRKLVLTTPRGVYEIFFTDKADPDDLGKVVAPLRRDPEGKMTGQVAIHPSWTEDGTRFDQVLGLLRTLVRGDEYVHAQLARPDRPVGQYFPARFQELALDQMAEARRAYKKKRNNIPNRVLLHLPGGVGKTIIAMMEASEHFGGDRNEGYGQIGENDLLIVTVEDVDILRGHMRKMQPYFRLSDSQIAPVFAGRTRGQISNDARIVFITRSSLFNRLDEVTDLVALKQRRGGKVQVVVDEAHDAALVVGSAAVLSAEMGQFQQILTHFNANFNKDVHLTFLSATPMHASSEMMTDIHLADGSVVSPLLTIAEANDLKQGQGVERLSNESLLRAMLMGFASPQNRVESYRFHHGGRGVLPSRSEGDSETVQVRTIIPSAMVNDIADDIMRNRRPGKPPREIIFMRGTDNVNELASALQSRIRFLERLKRVATEDLTEVMAFHSGNRTRNSEDGVEWFNSKAKRPRVLVVDGLVNQGVDVVDTDGVLILRRIDVNSRHSIRNAEQAIMRGSRLAAGKIEFYAIDYSGGNMRTFRFLPDRIESQSRGLVPSSLDGDRPEIVRHDPTVEDHPFVRFGQVDTVIPEQELPAAIKSRAELYDGYDWEEILQVRSPLAEVDLTTQILRLLKKCEKISSDSKEEEIARDKDFGPILVAEMKGMQEYYELMYKAALDVKELAKEELSEGQLTKIQAKEREIQRLWLGLYENHIRKLDPKMNSQVTVRFDGDKNTGPSALRSFYEQLISEYKILYPGVELEIVGREPAVRNDPLLEIKGTHAYAMFFSEHNMPNRVVKSRPGGRSENQDVLVHVSTDSRPRFKIGLLTAASSGSRRSGTLQAVNHGVQVNLIDKWVDMPELARNYRRQVINVHEGPSARHTVSFTDATDTHRLVNARLYRNMQRYLKAVLDDVINDGLTDVAPD